jgi:hypothetical protein
MRKIVAVLLGCLAMTACGTKERYEGDVRFKVTEADSVGYRLVLAQELPRDAVSDWHSGRVASKQFQEPAKVNDEVICHVVQQETGEKGVGTDVEVTNCRKA